MECWHWIRKSEEEREIFRNFAIDIETIERMSKEMDSKGMKREMREVLEGNILHFWMERMVDEKHGGFYGRMDGQGRLHPEADKGAVLNARILWSFAAAYRVLGKEEYKVMATRAKNYILAHFIDDEHGGVFWSVDYLGRPKDMKKQTYAMGFMIYGFSEYYRATGEEEALAVAIRLFENIECHAFDAEGVGYIEALTRQWQSIADMRLSDKDENGSRTMNTHLHILEPYTNLYRAMSNVKCQMPNAKCQMVCDFDAMLDLLRSRLRTLIQIFTDKLLNPSTNHLDLFFNDQWQGRRDIESYGHDIEAAWLLTETLEVLDDKELKTKTMPVVARIAKASEEGLMADGSMIHERNTRTEETDCDRHWWVQCECIIGLMNQYHYFGDMEALQRALHCWEYVKRHLIDWQGGEWLWSIRADGTVNWEEDKAGPWKCPYHNSRLCLEIIERTLT